MLRKFSETFTATHFTILAAIAMIVPGTVYATVSSQAVSVTDPTTGVQALVDNARRVSVYDPVAGYQNNPLNFVKLIAICSPSGNLFSYTPPSGKALIIKAANFTYFGATTGNDNYVYIVRNGVFIGGLEGVDASKSGNADFGNGYSLSGGNTLSLSCSNTGSYYADITGYLVPAALAPSFEAGQTVEPSTPFVKNGKRI